MQFCFLPETIMRTWVLAMLLVSWAVNAESPDTSDAESSDVPGTVYIQSSDLPQQAVYDAVYDSLEQARFYVVFEPDIGQNLSRLATRWGEDYNRNNLTAIRSMVFCNAWFANRVSNRDPNMLGICPLHLTVIERHNGDRPETTVLFNRPTAVAANSPARQVLENIESEVIEAIRTGIEQASKKPAEQE
jgi:hypothetical protein